MRQAGAEEAPLGDGEGGVGISSTLVAVGGALVNPRELAGEVRLALGIRGGLRFGGR